MRCEVVFEAMGAAPLPDLVTMHNAEDEREIMHVPEDDPLYAQLSYWWALPTEGRRSFRFFVGDEARHLVLCNWDREEIVRLPVTLTPKRVNRIEW